MGWFSILKSTFYHVTSKSNADSIIREGRMKKGKNRNKMGESAVWAFSNYDDALEYMIDKRGRGSREELMNVKSDDVIIEIIPDKGFDFTPGRMQIVTYTGMSGAPATKLESVMIYRGDKDLEGSFKIIFDDITKNQIVGAKQGVLTSDSPLPKKKKPDDNRCRNILRQWNANAFKIQSRIWNAIQDWKSTGTNLSRKVMGDKAYPEIYFKPRGINEELFKTIPEEIACKTIEIVNRFYENPSPAYQQKHLGWSNELGYIKRFAKPTIHIDKVFEVMCQYDIGGKHGTNTTYGQDNNISHMKVYLWEMSKSQKTAIWRAEVILVEPAFLIMGEEESFLFTDFEEFDIRELDWRESQ